MKNFVRQITLSFIAITACSEAFAQFYLGAGVGGVYSNTQTGYTENSSTVLFSPTQIGTSLFSLPNVNWRNRFKSGFDLNAELGYQFDCNWSSSVEFLYQNIKRKSHGDYGWLERNSVTGATYSRQPGNPISNVDKRANVYSFLTNLAYDINPNSSWPCFISAGIGVSGIHSNRPVTNDIINIDDPVTPLVETAPARQTGPYLHGAAFAWQAKAGIRHDICHNMALALQYRIMGTSHFRAGKSVITSNPGTDVASDFYIGERGIKGLLTQAIELNLRYNLC